MRFGGVGGDPQARWLSLSIVDSDTMHNLDFGESWDLRGEMDVDL